MDDGIEQPRSIESWLRAYHMAIEQPHDIQPYPNGWASVVCPQPESHTVDPRLSPPTFSVNVYTGVCRCAVCGAGGGLLALTRMIRKIAPDVGDSADSRKIELEPYVPVVQNEVNVRAFPSEQKHFYRRDDGFAFLVAMTKPAVDANFVGDTVYAHREGDRWLWGIGANRTLYHKELLVQSTDTSLVIVVGNEDSADAVQIEIDSASSNPSAPDAATTTWIGSDASWRHTKAWRETLVGKNVVCWPDQSDRSINTMLAIADNLTAATKTTWFVDVGRTDLPSGCTPGDAMREGVSLFDVIRRYGMKVDHDSLPERRATRKFDAVD